MGEGRGPRWRPAKREGYIDCWRVPYKYTVPLLETEEGRAAKTTNVPEGVPHSARRVNHR